jgi:hypothetical protein
MQMQVEVQVRMQPRSLQFTHRAPISLPAHPLQPLVGQWVAPSADSLFKTFNPCSTIPRPSPETSAG